MISTSRTITAAAILLALVCAALPDLAWAAAPPVPDLTGHWAALTALAVFVLAYVLVIGEETIHLRKSKPVIVAAGVIWVLVALTYASLGDTETAEQALEHDLLEFVELFLFLLAAMTYINTMEERGVFDVLRAWLVTRNFSLRQIFWITGAISFVLSPIADNLTTALLMATVVVAVGGRNLRFVGIACVNIVVAANAGGAFSPFGDITTLMVWQAERVEFQEFFVLFVPSLVNWLVTAAILNFAVGSEDPEAVSDEARLQYGALVVIVLFLLTIAMAVLSHNLLHLPPVIGMMTGLGLLKLFGYYLQRRDQRALEATRVIDGSALGIAASHSGSAESNAKFYNIYNNLKRAEWDTLMFFYGVILCVGGLGAFGYLAVGSQFMYADLGPTVANIIVGFASAIVDNIPVMFAVLEMDPDMGHGQWLLVTLTAGVGGSMLSIGSAAGVAVMGQARGIYTFFSHLKWSWAIALGYFASIWTHFLVNAETFAR
ncbi:MAG: sodium:proton antiporter [Xanthomonadales bacterium]|nr:sodium:proton antiporter [Xanthomonadales bacterium]NIN60039.1 sodium:proton antiporter [Xanthomonadales bacterium]NIN75407.1 sodium:proton antiporter [Xanthomonadales bacterium]NIO14230.1 sodium:proton antiporter [Xanthomonadales bacterium]NIP12432.1 sodium:proton antiporter [Xanthomonadales bacterium]